MPARSPVFLGLALVGALALGACGSDDASADVPDLDGTSWTASSVEGYELAGTLDLVFDDGRISASGGCNSLNGAYSIDDGVLTAGPLASTMMACADALMDQDAWFAGVLEAGVDVSAEGDDLVLTGEDTTIVLSPLA